MNKKNIRDKIFILVSLAVYMVITFIITMYHENWRDEAQSWMIAKNLSFVDIFKQLKYEGHPFIFYYIIHIFAELGFEYRIVNMISWIIMSIVAYIILAKSPFNKINKVLILLTLPFIYQYVAFGRSYCLVTLFVILIAYLYNKKEKHPYIYAILISLLMNTHIIMLGFVAMLILTFYVYELIFNRKNLSSEQKKKYIISLVIIFVSALLILFQFYSTLSLNTYTKTFAPREGFTERLEYIIEIVMYLYTYVLTNNIYIAIVATIMIIMTIALTIKFKPGKEILVLLGTIGFQLVFFFKLGESKKYILMTAFLAYIFYLWVILKKNQELNDKTNKQYKSAIEITFGVICILSALFGSVKDVWMDLKYEYSSSKSVASYIENNIEEGAVFLCIDDTLCGSIMPYLNDNYYFYSLISDSYYKFVNWDENRNIGIQTPEYISKIQNFLENNRDLEEIYIIFNYCPSDAVYQHLLKEEKIMFEYMAVKSYTYVENYYIYKIIK